MRVRDIYPQIRLLMLCNSDSASSDLRSNASVDSECSYPIWYVWRSRLDHQHPTGGEWRLRMILLVKKCSHQTGLNATTIFAQWHMPGIDVDLVSQELSTLMKFRVRSGNEPMSRSPIRFSRVSQERVSVYIEPSVSVKDIEFPIPDMPSKGELPCCHYALVR